MQLCDYHTHTRISPDADYSCYHMVEAAMKAGFSEIVLTDHYDIPALTEYYPDYRFDYDKMRAEFEKVKAEFLGKIKVKLGIELGQANHIPEMAEEFLAKGPLDFVLLSHHNCKNEQDYYFMDFAKVDPNQVMKKHLESTYDTVGWKDYDVLAHLTYPIRYIMLLHPEFQMKPFNGLIDEVLRRLIDTGHGIEVNTGTLRKGFSFTMPDFTVVKRYLELGGEIITVGSDAHFPCDVGADIPEVRKSLFELGAKYLATYENRQISYIAMA